MSQNLEKYSLSMRIMHGLSGIIFIFTLILGFLLHKKIISGEYFFFHKSFGIIVFLLTLMRILIKAKTKNVPEVFSDNKFELILAKSVHFGLYLCLILMPLSGYFMSSFYAGKLGSVNFFNLFQIPFWTDKNLQFASFFGSSHEIISYISLILVGLHILGSLKHLIFAKINIFKKMI
jgi:cytochrome b561